MRLKNVAVGIFQTIATDDNLLNLLEVPSTNMEDIRKQIIEDKYPNDLIQDNLSRLCVYENPTSYYGYDIVEKSFVEIDAYVTKENNELDRRVLKIINRLFELFHKTNIDGFQLIYYNRLPNMPIDNPDWVKYGIVFKYVDFIV